MVTKTSNWTGSLNTFELVRKQIANRWGDEEATNYDPKRNCLTFNQWHRNGYSVKKGEKALQSFIVIEKKDENGNVISKYWKKISLFYICQVQKMKSTK